MRHRRESPYYDRHEYHNATLDTISRALRRVARSPFSNEIECIEMPRRFTCLPFTIYDGKTNPVKHVSHYIQMMSLYSQNNILMCKVFLSSLKPMVMRWLNGLRKGSIRNFGELMQVFGVQFIMCSKVS